MSVSITCILGESITDFLQVDPKNQTSSTNGNWAGAIEFDPLEVCYFFSSLLLRIIYLFYFLAAVGLCSYVQAFSSCGKQSLLFIMVHGLLIAVASLVAHSLQVCGLQ